jgi:hypothetical protein
MMPVKATPPFERYLNKNLGRSLYFGWDNFAVVALFHLVRIYMDWPVMNFAAMSPARVSSAYHFRYEDHCELGRRRSRRRCICA